MGLWMDTCIYALSCVTHHHHHLPIYLLSPSPIPLHIYLLPTLSIYPLATQEIDNKLLQQSIEVKTTECTHLKTKLSVLDISLKALEDRIASLQESNNHLAGDLRALQDVYGVAKKRVDLLEDSLHVSCRSCWWSVETVGGLLKLLM
jgi:hypothetical protein